jgi:hypothetical protein
MFFLGYYLTVGGSATEDTAMLDGCFRSSLSTRKHEKGPLERIVPMLIKFTRRLVSIDRERGRERE